MGQSNQFSLDKVRRQFADRLRFDDHEHDGDYQLNPDFRKYLVDNATRDAAVLIGLIEREVEVNVLLTKRAEQLNSHSGQVAFPGGKIDRSDGSPEAAALREAHEEVGLEPHRVEIIGRMPDYYSGSGFKIAPVLGVVDPTVELVANPEEVDYVFEVPLSFLMNPDNHRQASRVFQGRERFYLEMPYGEHFIWGVTAGIIRVIHDRVFGADT